MNLNIKQVLAIILVILGVLVGATAQLTDLFGPNVAKAIVGLAGLLNSILAGILGLLTSQSATIKDVQAMPGVESITINKEANQTLAQLAVDQAQPKIEATPAAAATIQAIAKGA